jgi:hypothetical protein
MSKTWYAKSKPKLRELVKATLFIDQIIATSKNRCTRLVEGFRTHRSPSGGGACRGEMDHRGLSVLVIPGLT